VDDYPGRYALALAGREKGKNYIVLYTEGDFAFISNGKERKIEKPKKKKLKHLKILSLKDDYISQKLVGGQKISNAEIRKSLKKLEPDRQVQE